MRGFWSLGLIAAAGMSACATAPREDALRTALVFWPKTAGVACDFEEPQRDGAYALSYSETPRPAARRTGPQPMSQAYAVRNAQMQVRPQAGETFCLTLRRGRTFGPTEAVLGFEVFARTPEALEITPVSVRIDAPAVRGLTGRMVGVAVGFASGPYDPNRSERVSAVRFQLGTVATDGVARSTTEVSQTLLWPEADQRFDILRFGAVVVETRDGGEPRISDDDLQATLSARP